MSAELTEALFTQAAGWDAVKRARAYLAQGHVLSSYWAPPLLRGVVQGGEISYPRFHGDQERGGTGKSLHLSRCAAVGEKFAPTSSRWVCTGWRHKNQKW